MKELDRMIENYDWSLFNHRRSLNNDARRT